MIKISNKLVNKTDPNIKAVLEKAYADKERPLCMCTSDGVEMYIAKIDNLFVVKRMPNSGYKHHFSCENFDPPGELSGLNEVAGKAIQENPKTGEIKLRLDFSLSKSGNMIAPVMGEPSGIKGDVESNPSKLTLLSTLHYLWEKAGLLKWKPEWSDKRKWGYVRAKIFENCSNLIAKKETLSSFLFIPETFVLDKAEEIKKRQNSLLYKALYKGYGEKKYLLLVAELKEINTERYGYEMVFKHLPNLKFVVQEDIIKKVFKKYKDEFALWAERENKSHLIVIGTFYKGVDGRCNLENMAFLLVNQDWIPIEDANECFLIDMLNSEYRSYIKSLRYNLSINQPVATCVLTDTENTLTAMYIKRAGDGTEYADRLDKLISESSYNSWVWDLEGDIIPNLPSLHKQI